ncbi:MAG TPA: hypothetical protein VK871_12225 [Candidatus Limnocylindrales bacterium]|nr:hypothetical protein [Candidatus Limnocylindrales bacterium]
MSVFATLEPASLSVEPGAQAALSVRVRNGGSIVDRFELTIVGPLAAYARAEPASLSLFPGQEGTAVVTFALPREPSPRAGTFPYGIRVLAAADPGGATVEEGRVTVGAYNDAAAEVVPVTSRGSRTGRHEVVVQNHGNAPLDVLVGAADPDRLVDFEVRPDRFVIPPGERGGASVRASVRDTFFLGSKQPHPFNVEVRAGKAPPITLRATMLQGPILPTWLVPVGGIVLAAVLAIVILPRLTGGGSGPQARASDEPTATPSVSIGPSAEVSVPPSAEASVPPSASADGGPSPTPTPTPLPSFALEPVTTDTVATNFDLVCQDETCQADVINGMRFLAANLQTTYFGGGLSGTQSFSSAMIPVVLAADAPFQWKAADGTGTTDRFVIDLAPLVFGTGPAYAVLEDETKLLHRNLLPNDFALQLFDRLYDSKAMPVPTYKPVDWGVIDDQLLLPIDDIDLFLPTPSP